MARRLAYQPLRPALVRMELQWLDPAHEVVRYGSHSHDFFEIVVFTEPGGMHAVAGVNHPISRGQVWLLRPGVFHDLADMGATEGWLVIVAAEVLGLPPGLVDVLPWPTHPLVAPFQHVDDAGRPIPVQLSARRLRTWSGWLAAMRAEADEARAGYAFAMQAWLHLLLVDAARSTATGSGRISEPLVDRAMAVVDDQFRGPLSLAAVARQLSVTPGHLTELVRLRTGRPLGEWILQRRMAEARLLLGETRHPVSAVSEACGFTDVGHFARQFRRIHGTSPSGWRAEVLRDQTR